MAPAGVAEAMGGGCPAGRVKCDGKCCPKHARCKNGRCKCRSGFTKCGRKCVDRDTSVTHCGECGKACAEGESCVAGECQSGAICGNDQIEGGEVCDGSDLGGEDCVSQGFAGGTLACNPDCGSYNTFGCVECLTTQDCGSGRYCSSGTCVYGCDSNVGCPAPNTCQNNHCGCASSSSCGAGAGTCQYGECVNGLCQLQYVPAGQDPLDECPGASTCDGTGGCAG